MLRIGRAPGPSPSTGESSAGSIRFGLRGGTSSRPLDIWQEQGSAPLADIVRRVCTLCGWSRNTTGIGRTLAVTSAVEREGKSTVARTIAIAMAHDHAGEVVLVEADLLRPTLAADCGVESSPGLADVLSGADNLESVLRASGLPNLALLPAGSPTPHPSRLLRSEALTSLLENLRERFAFIVLDLPAVLRSSDAAVLAEMTDGAVFVVRAGSTDQRNVQEALGLLSGATMHGIVLNRWRSSMPGFVRRIFES
jgi:capsular exopolysaccharide synthesis family protein